PQPVAPAVVPPVKATVPGNATGIPPPVGSLPQQQVVPAGVGWRGHRTRSAFVSCSRVAADFAEQVRRLLPLRSPASGPAAAAPVAAAAAIPSSAKTQKPTTSRGQLQE
ncbi:hypothetical protein HDU96_002353, partial [Phlyctochytrium bullatum]